MKKFNKDKLKSYLEQGKGLKRKTRNLTGKTAILSLTGVGAMGLIPLELDAQTVCGTAPTPIAGSTIPTYLGYVFQGGADFDGDGNWDMAWAYGGGNIFVMRRTGTGLGGALLTNAPYTLSSLLPFNYALDSRDIGWTISLPSGGFGFANLTLSGGVVTVHAWGSSPAASLPIVFTSSDPTVCPDPPLPVELSAFKAQVLDNDVQLAWETATETENAGFEVERSTDGRRFSSLGFVEGNGNSSEVQSYTYTDKDLKAGQTYFYRLKQVDFDGSFEYSEVISARITGKELSATLFPNPGKGMTNIQLETPAAGNVDISVFDATGKMLLTENLPANEGMNTLPLDLSDIQEGIYFVKMEQGDLTAYERLIIE